MPPAFRPRPRIRQRLKRTQWRNVDARLQRERDSFEKPLNDLSFEERYVRVRILMNAAYRMGRRDQYDAERLRKSGAIRAKFDKFVNDQQPRRRPR